MEGKTDKLLRKDCQAVSEVVGQVLMIAVVVIILTSIAITIFSGDILDPPHTPHVDLEIYPEKSILYVLHVGGEAIELKDLKVVIFNNSGVQAEFIDLSKYSETNTRNNGILMFGEYIKIDTGIQLINGNSMEIVLVHMPSQQVILKSAI